VSQESNKSLTDIIGRPERDPVLTVRGVNFQFHGETWPVAYSPAAAEADQPVVGGRASRPSTGSRPASSPTGMTLDGLSWF
jgi:hypothetical protein